MISTYHICWYIEYKIIICPGCFVPVSDSCYFDNAEDRSGPNLAAVCKKYAEDNV